MPAYSQTSRDKLETCDPRLQRVFTEVVKTFDNTITCGHRDESAQNEAFRTGQSKLGWPNSKHNRNLSEGVDSAPYPINWNDIRRFDYYAGFVMATAASMGIKLRWGGDWDGDTQVKDQTFNDLVHFEVVD
ncbi:M15 family peptidase [Candidatus Pacearchaeota archaeon]|nr:M15 family peptidase [Candidatus Pacearchaeota archaeon]